MAYGFLDIAMTPGVRAAQAANGSAGLYDKAGANRAFDRFTDAEAAFIAARDSFYMASVVGNRLALCSASRRPGGLPEGHRRDRRWPLPIFAATGSTSALGNTSAERPRRADPDGLSATAGA